MTRGTVRIIAGQWRGRRVKVPSIENLRPTPDRVRETLFNWLAPVIQGARCLDVFSGSGILGFEALSRGAAQVIMVDESQDAVDLITSQLQHFDAHNAVAYRASAPGQLRVVLQPFDIAFIDPPYDSELLFPTCQYLEENNFLADGAYIYLEARHTIKDNELPAGWHVVRHQQAGQVMFHLIHRESDKNE